MTMNANLMNAICENAANAIAKEAPSFEAFYKSLDEFKSLEANVNGILDCNQIADAIARMNSDVFDTVINGGTLDEINSLADKHNALIRAQTFINRDAHYAYQTLSIMFDNITSEVGNGEFEVAFRHFEELKNFSVTGISNPLDCIDLSAIKDELNYAKRECMKLAARDAACKNTAREIAESCRDGFAVLGAVAAVAADLTLGVKVLKKILK